MSICEQLKLLEETLLRPEIRNDTAQVSLLLAVEFREIGSSGRFFSRNAILDDLQADTHPRKLSLSKFECIMLSDTLALVTYMTLRESPSSPPVSALRSSIWTYRDARWQVLFHQGTPAA